uniref:sphingosine kinase n=1 Tax=Pipistrellus kuhlii TaxID=59472 RepID=A0A7J7QSR4_PIPKU|nr:sphingosine kinase 2 [Pipistrellus kuhlii]
MAPPPLSPLATSTPLLHGEFGSYPARGPRFALTLTPQALHIQRLRPKPEARPRGGLVLLAEVSGCCTLRSRSPSDSAAYLCIYTYPRGRRGGRRRATRTFGADGAATYEENRAEVQRWATVLTCLLRGLQLPGNGEITSHLLPRPPRLLLLVNPFGGRGLAWQLCKNHVLPMISEAGLSFNLIQTERQNHARELVQGLSLSEWDGIVTVSGDGLLYEVLNGLLDRPDWEEAMKTPVGILPCGSGNALAGAVNQHGGKAARTDIWFSLSRRASRDRLAASLFLYRRLQYFSSWGCRGGQALRSRGAPPNHSERRREEQLGLFLQAPEGI